MFSKGRASPRGFRRRAAWWSQTGSNRRPHACKARALPTELWPHFAIERHIASARRRSRLANPAGFAGFKTPNSLTQAPNRGHRDDPNPAMTQTRREAPQGRPAAAPDGAKPKRTDVRAGDRGFLKMVGLGGLEPPTSRLSSARSNQLSYKPELSRFERSPRESRPATNRARPLVKKERRRRRRPANAVFDKTA